MVGGFGECMWMLQDKILARVEAFIIFLLAFKAAGAAVGSLELLRSTADIINAALAL